MAKGVFELRRAGYNIITERKRDDFGRRYAKYTLVRESGQLSAA